MTRHGFRRSEKSGGISRWKRAVSGDLFQFSGALRLSEGSVRRVFELPVRGNSEGSGMQRNRNALQGFLKLH